MNATDFVRIEKTLGFSLPNSYKSLLASYPSEADDDIRSHAVFFHANHVIKENLAHRKEGWFRLPWPDCYFVVGDNGCGDTISW